MENMTNLCTDVLRGNTNDRGLANPILSSVHAHQHAKIETVILIQNAVVWTGSESLHG